MVNAKGAIELYTFDILSAFMRRQSFNAHEFVLGVHADYVTLHEQDHAYWALVCRGSFNGLMWSTLMPSP